MSGDEMRKLTGIVTTVAMGLWLVGLGVLLLRSHAREAELRGMVKMEMEAHDACREAVASYQTANAELGAFACRDVCRDLPFGALLKNGAGVYTCRCQR